MINLVIAFISIILWIVIFITKPYCHIKSNFWVWFWILLFGVIGGIAGGSICQSVIYLCGGQTIF